MRKNALTILLMSVLIAIAGSVFAQKTTIDPNSLPKVDDDKPDVRLEQKVTYEAKNKSVSAILADFSKASGVTLKAGINEKDWQVRDRKMNIFAKDVPLKDLMDSIARVMKFMWASGKKDGEKTYRLFMDRKTLLDAESKAARDLERMDKERADNIAKGLKAFANPVPPTEAELAQMKKDNPLQYLAAKSGWSTGMGTFLKEAPAALEAMASGKQMAFNGSSLSPAAQAGLVNAIKGMSAIDVGDKLPDDLVSEIGNASIKINQGIDMIEAQGMGSMMLGIMEVRVGDHTLGIPLLNPDSKLVKMIGDMLVKCQDMGVAPDDYVKNNQADFENAMSKAMSEEMNASDPGEEAPKRPDDPSLLAKIKLQPKSGTLIDTEQALQEATQFAVVSDNFGIAFNLAEMRMRGKQKTEETTLKEALDKIGDSFRYNWDKHESIIELRDKKWYSKRANQIPEEWLERWRNTLKETGTLDLDDLCEIASLTMDQIQQNILPDEVFTRSGITNMLYIDRELHKLYNSLNDNQRKAIFTTNGLDLSTLSDNQWELAQRMINQRNGNFLQNPNAQLLLTATKSENGKGYRYTFKLTTSESMASADWNIQTPVYVEPPKDTPIDVPIDGKPGEPAKQPEAGK